MLGDLIERALAKVGVTTERVERWLGRPCGCKERRDKLNQLTAWAARKKFSDDPESSRYLTGILEL